MNDSNQVTVTGRLTRDPEIKYTASGTALGKFSMAVNRSFKSGDEWKEEVSFFDVTVWGKSAENLALFKGDRVLVMGELKQDRWEQDGQKRSRVEITARVVESLVSAPKAQKQEAPKEDDFEDDIPF